MRSSSRYSAGVWDGSPAPDQSVGRALVLPGGCYTVDHSLQLDSDWRASIGVLHHVLAAIEAFASTIPQETR